MPVQAAVKHIRPADDAPGVVQDDLRPCTVQGLNSVCCGAGGGNFGREEKEPRVSWNRAAEIMESGAPTLAVSCPFCMAMLEDGLKAQEGYDERPVRVRHVVELVAEAIPGSA